MSCLRTRQMLDAWQDGELDAGSDAELRRHVEGCAECAALHRQREALRAAIRSAPRHVAPEGLRRAIVARLGEASAQGLSPTRRPMLAWWQALMLAAGSAALGVLATALVLRGPATMPPQEQLVARHVASLASARLIEVASSDRHVVKPWFQGKVDFAPQVRDLAAHGFVLEGARLERIGGKDAVAVVYRIRKHPVNLFVWRGGALPAGAPEVMTVRGFSIAAWSAGGLDYAAVADTDLAEMRRFALALTAAP